MALYGHLVTHGSNVEGTLPDALAILTGRFDSAWANELAEFLEADDQTLQREVAFLVDRRNKIAHGLNEGVGPVKALALKGVACDVGDWFIARLILSGKAPTSAARYQSGLPRPSREPQSRSPPRSNIGEDRGVKISRDTTSAPAQP